MSKKNRSVTWSTFVLAAGAALAAITSGCSVGAVESEALMRAPENLVGEESFTVELSWQAVCGMWISHPTSGTCREQEFRASFDCGEIGCLVEKRTADGFAPVTDDDVFEGSQLFRVTPAGVGQLQLNALVTNERTDETLDVAFNDVRVWDPAGLTMGVACDVEVDGSEEAGERPCAATEDRTAVGETIRTLYFSTTMTANDGTSFAVRSPDYEVEGAADVARGGGASLQNDGRVAIWLLEAGTLTFRTSRDGFGTRELSVQVR
jgi:hypothetical protein